MGRQVKQIKISKIAKIDLAYISGFLDGDGSVMVQVKRVKTNSRPWRLMFTICFYQDTRHEKPLFWIQKRLGIGYISHRNDGMTELRINGYEQTRKILEAIYPYVKFKKKQIGYILQILNILKFKKSLFDLKKKDRIRIANAILKSRQETYQSGLKKTEKLKSDLKKIIEI